jgi:type IV pilus assembly protein PilA
MKISFKRFDLGSRGFSIIELMVVVAMISIMAIIGIPQYKKFVAKARQAEAKIQLSGIFAAEAAFHFEYNGYSSNLRVIGYAPRGTFYYQAGFQLLPCLDWNDCAPEYGQMSTGIRPSDDRLTTFLCSLSDNSNLLTFEETGCHIVVSKYSPRGTGLTIGARPVGAVFFNSLPTTTTYTVEASAIISEGYWTIRYTDIWRMDQNKVLSQLQNGL